jgi:hypothetical protein
VRLWNYGFNAQTGFSSGFIGEEPPNMDKMYGEKLEFFKSDRVCFLN